MTTIVEPPERRPGSRQIGQTIDDRFHHGRIEELRSQGLVVPSCQVVEVGLRHAVKRDNRSAPRRASSWLLEPDPPSRVGAYRWRGRCLI